MDNKAIPHSNGNERLTNLDFLHEISDGNMDFFKEFIQTFLDNAPESLDGMKQGLDNQDWDTVKKTAHKIRPSFNYLGLKDLEQIATQVEKNAAEGTNLNQMPEMIEKIISTCNQAIDELQNDLRSMAA